MTQSVSDLLSKLPRFQTVVVGEDGHTYGVQTSQVAVTTSSALLLGNNNNRVSWTFCNFGAGQVYVGWTAPIATSNGFPIFANGGVLETNVIDDKNIARMPVYVIGDAASTVAIIEVIRVD